MLPRSLIRSDVVDLDLEVVAGEWPADIGGEIFISAPDLQNAAGHPFFTTGLVHRLSLDPGRHGAPAGTFAWRTRTVDTPSSRFGRRHPELFPPGPFGSLLGSAGFVNGANTAPLPWGDRLFVTWDVGRPVEIDPVTLEFLGEVGHREDWAPLMPGIGSALFPLISTTAHPVIDPERDLMWSVNLTGDATNPMERAVSVVCYSGDGAHVVRRPVAGATIPGSMHTISQTPDWLVLVDSGGFKTDPGEIAGGDRTVLVDEDEAVFLVRKDEFLDGKAGEPVDAIGLRAGPATGHFYAAYEEGSTLRVLFEHMENVDLAFYMRPDDETAEGRPVDAEMAGMYAGAMSPARLTEFEFDPDTGQVKDQAQFIGDDRYWSGQLSAMDWSIEGLSAPTAHHMTFLGWRPEMVSKRLLDLYTAGGRVDPADLPAGETPSRIATLQRGSLAISADHEFARDELASSPTFVPRDPGTAAGRTRYAGAAPGGHDGFVAVPVHADAGFRVEVFDAADVGRGPLAVLAAPGGATVPMLLHSAWMPRAAPAPDVERLAFADEIDDAALAALEPDAADSIRAIADTLA